MTDQQRGATVPPSRTSVLVMAVVTLLSIYGTFWAAMTGEVFDGRNLVGFLLGILASAMLIGQTAARLGRLLEAEDEQRERVIQARIAWARHLGSCPLEECGPLPWCGSACRQVGSDA